MAEWQRAVSDWSRMKAPRQPERKEHRRKGETSKYMKTYQNSFNQDRLKGSHFQSKSYAQIKVPGNVDDSYDVSADLSHKEVTETNAETGKRHYYTKADSV
jgi:hypothetical protein